MGLLRRQQVGPDTSARSKARATPNAQAHQLVSSLQISVLLDAGIGGRILANRGDVVDSGLKVQSYDRVATDQRLCAQLLVGRDKRRHGAQRVQVARRGCISWLRQQDGRGNRRPRGERRGSKQRQRDDGHCGNLRLTAGPYLANRDIGKPPGSIEAQLDGVAVILGSWSEGAHLDATEYANAEEPEQVNM